MRSYPSIYNVGHRAAAGIFDGPVVVQEKVDGSQFSFGLVHQDEPGSETEREAYGLVMRSKGATVFSDTADKLFRPAVETVKALFDAGKLQPGWTYRGEAFAKPKHNTLAYERVPAGNIILFDVDTGEESYIPQTEGLDGPDVIGIAIDLGLEVVPTLFEGQVTGLEQLHGFLERTSILGGAKIEGVVIKAYGRYGPDKKTLMAKYVSEAFKEVHRGDWKERNPSTGDILLRLIDRYRTPARWQKAVQHLREAGTLQDAPQDIGPLMKEVGLDVLKEERTEIMQALFDYAWPKLQRGITAGLPQWYKDELAKTAFATPAPTLADVADPRPVAA